MTSTGTDLSKGSEPVATASDRLRITDDDWFTVKAREFEAMDREQLLNEARTWAFNAQEYKRREIAALRGSDHLIADLRSCLGRVGKLLDRTRKTLRMDDLRIALRECEMCNRPGEAIWHGRVMCRAHYDQIVSRVPDKEV